MAACGLRILAVVTFFSAVNVSAAATDAEIRALIASGSYAEAERQLKGMIADPSAPITSDAAVQLEIVRRTRSDFPLTEADVLTQIQKSIPDANFSDIARWREAGDLHHKLIDGQIRYFRQAVPNLFRFNDEAKRRRRDPSAGKKFDLNAHLERLVALAETSANPELFPVKHIVRYEVSVNEGHPRFKAGAKVRAWLPFPQEYRQQRDVKLIRSEPAEAIIAPNGVPHRTIYLEQIVRDETRLPRFFAEFEFVTSAYCPKLDASKAKPYDTTSDLYREYTTERPPHIAFTPEVRRLAREIVGKETNPLEKALLVFRWVSANVPWCSEMEYSIIPNLSEKGLSARRGDCGVQGMVFITLCRAAGVPARWQSGWQTKPGDWNMHDWSEFYVEPWGWLPADASYGVREHADPRVKDFFCGHMDPYRLIVNVDYASQLQPPKTSFRSEPNDFQRGEIEIDGHNLYFDEWDWTIRVETTALNDPQATTLGN